MALVYTISKNHAIVDSLVDQFYAGAITIDETIVREGVTYPVLEIKRGAFSGRRITGVKINAKLETINRDAFSSCKSLETINIPETCTYIGQYAFYECVKLQYINIPASCTEICMFAFALNTASSSELKKERPPLFVEFYPGRTEAIKLGKGIFKASRKKVEILYPCEIPPIFDKKDEPFKYTKEIVICAPVKMDFYTQPVEGNFAKCPAPKYKPDKVETFGKNIMFLRDLRYTLACFIFVALSISDN